MAALISGQFAPDFTATAHTGEQVSLAALRGNRVVVLFFYPRDNTAICTKEACAFRDAFEDFTQAGAVVIGISSDSDATHQQFAGQHRLPFVLISDSDGALRRAFGVSDTLGLVPKRVTFVIDKQGVVRHVFSALFSADRHVEEALRIVRQLSAE